MKYKIIVFAFFFCFAIIHSKAKPIVVDQQGRGDFLSIQAALNSLQNDSIATRIIYIKKGVYTEKIFIKKNNIILEGEDRGATIISQSIARDEWRCAHKDDWGVATINLNGLDIVFKNLTIENEYGFLHQTDVVINCGITDSMYTKTVRRDGHQMAVRSFATTRLAFINCTIMAYGGDTVSPWNVTEGMFYFKDCRMEGGVDFFCPRGWSWAENCEFYAYTGPASIWHDGSGHEDSKTVLMNCHFMGYKGFLLGRYHKDAQFYLINCHFDKNMADKPIYRVPTNNIIQWGERVYYYNCHRTGGDYSWFADNLTTSKTHSAISDITIQWLFGNRWNPLKFIKIKQ